jgi:hypothetical protein
VGCQIIILINQYCSREICNQRNRIYHSLLRSFKSEQVLYDNLIMLFMTEIDLIWKFENLILWGENLHRYFCYFVVFGS